MKKLYLISCLFLLINNQIQAQLVPLEFRQLDKSVGLDQPFPYSIIQDKKGFIWIGGENGLWRYSGSEFKHYYHSLTDSNSLAYDFVWQLLEDSKGNIWAGTYGGGLSKYNPNTSRFTNYIHNKQESNSISDNKIRGLEEDHNGYIWIGTDKGLNKLNPETGKFKRYGLKEGLASLTVRTIKESRDKTKLFICTGNGLDIFDLETESIQNIGEKEGLIYYYLYDLFEGENQILWVATGGGLEKIDLKTLEIEHVPSNYKKGKGVSHPVTFSIYQNPNNRDRIWLGTMNGIHYYDTKEERFYWVDAKQKTQANIGGNNIYNIFEDKNGGVWAAVNNAGVFHSHPSFNKFEYKNFLPKETDKYLNRYTSFLHHNDDEYLITTYSGLISWNKKKNEYQLFQIKEGDPGNVNRMTQIKKWKENEYLISTWGNFIYHWNHTTKELTPLNYQTNNNQVDFNLRIYVDSKKRIWLGNSLEGLHLYDFEKQKLSPISVSDLADVENSGDEYIKYIQEDEYQTIWVGTADGLHYFNEEDSSFIKFEASQKEGHLSNGNINHISISQNNGLWISTEVGLNFFSFQDSTFTRYFKKNGLPSNVISAALEDKNGNVWISTTSGLSKMNKEGEFSNYDQSDGLREEYFIFGSAFQDENGSLFFGTSREFIHFQVDDIQYNRLAPKVYFNKLTINNQVINSQKRPDILKESITRTKSITLTPNDYLVQIKFDALNLINGHKNQYAVLMEGLDETWRPETDQKSVTFSNLKPGEYLLRLKAVNDENIWSKEEATLAINVLPYWYKSLWFRVLLSLSIFLFIGLIIRWRFNQIKNRNLILEDLVGKRTQEVLAQKEEIESQNEVLQSRNERIELLLRELNHRIKNNLQLISSILNLHSRSTLNLDAKIALTEGKLRMQALSILHQKLYMTEKYTEVDCKEYIKELLDYLSIAFKSYYSDVNYQLNIDEFKLNLDQAVPLGLILNELVTNSLKHSKKENLKIDLSAKIIKEKICITLKDNGSGISQEHFENSSSFGISMIKSLIDQIDGKFSVGSKDGPHFQLEFIRKELE